MRVMRRVLPIATAFSLLGGAGYAQTVDLARQEVRQQDSVSSAPAADPAPSRSSSSSSSNDPDDDSWTLEEMGGMLFLAGAAVSSPVWLPAMLLDDNYRVPGFFPPHPYEKAKGAVVIADEIYKPLRPWAAQVSFAYGNDFDGVARYGGQALVSTTQRVDFDTEWNWYREDQPDGAETIHTGDVNMMFRCAQSERVQLRIGLGMNWLVDEQDQDVGVNFTYNAQLYPVKPAVLTAELDWGTLGHAPLLHLRTTVGAVWHGCELFAGYDYRSIGQADLQGPMLGMRYHF